jgi:septal ring factor EnvC (AmiA/AmiB activator)
MRNWFHLYAAVLSVVVVCLEGCTLMQISRENEAAERRIYQKQYYVGDLQNQNRRLAEENRQLAEEKTRVIAELNAKKLTLSEMSSRLELLRRQNASIAATNEAKRREKEQVEARLRQYQGEISSLNSDTSLSDSAKRDRIEKLRSEIRMYLEMGLR